MGLVNSGGHFHNLFFFLASAFERIEKRMVDTAMGSVLVSKIGQHV
jgi:hypothetical protein